MTASWLSRLAEWVEGTTGLDVLGQRRLLLSLAVVAVIVLLRGFTLYLVARRSADVRTRYQWKKATVYLAFFVAVVALAWIWLRGLGPIATYFGLLSAGLAIALKEPVVNLAGWAFILWRRPFEVGDRIEVAGSAGDVIDIRIFQFSLLEIGNWVDADQSTGRVIHVPNGKVFTEALANYTKGFAYLWNEIPVLVTFESDWRKAKRLLGEIAERHGHEVRGTAEEQLKKAAQKFMIFYTNLTPTVYTSVLDSGVLLTIRYLCDPRRRRGSAQAIWEDVLAAFAEHDDIDFAYPTQRFYTLPGTGPQPPISGEGRGDG